MAESRQTDSLDLSVNRLRGIQIFGSWRRVLVQQGRTRSFFSSGLAVAMALVVPVGAAAGDSSLTRDQSVLAAYRAEIAQLRSVGRPSFKRSGPAFFLFGMGSRQKFVYRRGELVEWPSGRVLRQWDAKTEMIVPPSYSVWLTTAHSTIHIFEDESGIYLEENGSKTTLTASRVHLPAFSGERYPNILRVLHQEILVNIADGKPLPNFLVYSKPWYRDAAMASMVLRRTGNIGLIRDWILALRDPFDHNNAGRSEPDNLGEALYLISCVSDRTHPLVASVLQAVDPFKRNGYIIGVTDGAEHPVFQTKWLKFGLRSLGISDTAFVVPSLEDSYASLFWWALKDGQIGTEFSADAAQKYPYLAWARDHLSGGHTGPVTAGDYPLTWEADASEADYKGMSLVASDLAKARLAAPHAWHAAEMFLALASDKAAF